MSVCINNSFCGYINSDGKVEITYQKQNYLLSDPAVRHLKIIDILVPEKDHPRVLTIVVVERVQKAVKPAPLALVR